MENELDKGTLNQTESNQSADSSTASPEKDASIQIQTEPGGRRYGHGPGEVVPTTGETSLKPAVETETGDEKEKEADDDLSAESEKGKPEDDGKKGRLDKDERFKQVIESNKLLKETVATLTETLKELRAEKQKPEETVAYPNLLNKTDEELAEMMQNDPKAVLVGMYQQLKHETAAQLKTESEQGNREKGIKSTYEKFEKANPDFGTMWQAGEIQEFIEANPGHNPISAYHALTLENKIAEIKEQTRKEAEAAVLKKIRAKGGARSLGRGPSPESKLTGATQADPRLKSTKNYGGVVSVIADHLANLRRARGG